MLIALGIGMSVGLILGIAGHNKIIALKDKIKAKLTKKVDISTPQQ